MLGDILESLIEKDLSLSDIAGRNHDPAMVERVRRMLDKTEYKRRQGSARPEDHAPDPRPRPALPDHQRL